MITINLTQHVATYAQLEAGVIDVPAHLRDKLVNLLTFNTLPSKEDIIHEAYGLASLALDVLYELTEGSTSESVQLARQLHKAGVKTALGNICYDYQVMIGGAPFLMSHLEDALKSVHLKPVYAFSARESIDVVQDGKVVKTSTFKHLGFVEA